MSQLPASASLSLATAELPEGVGETYRAALAKMPEATLRAYRQDMSYLQTWHQLVFERELEWPAPVTVIQTFFAHHMFDPVEREELGTGMPHAIEKALRQDGRLTGQFPPAFSTVQRRIAMWRRAHKLLKLEHNFGRPDVQESHKALRVNVDTNPRRKSERSIDLHVLAKMLDTCEDNLVGLRDRALLMLMYATGGRRRSEPGKIRVEDVKFDTVPEDPEDPYSDRIPAFLLRLPRTKRTEQGYEVAAVGEPAEVLKAWIDSAVLRKGPLFPRFHVLGTAEKGEAPEVFLDRESRTGLVGTSVAAIVKKRLRLAGYDPKFYSAHGIRAGYLTDAQRNGVPLAEAMQQSTHRVAAQAMRYYNASAVMSGSARLFTRPKPKG